MSERPLAVDAAALTIERAERRVLARVQALEAQLDATDGDGLWTAYIEAVQALVVLVRDRQKQEPVRLLTTKELAQRMGVNERTIRRQRQAGILSPTFIGDRRSTRGRCLIRWNADAVLRGTVPGTGSANTAPGAPGYGLSRAVRPGRVR